MMSYLDVQYNHMLLEITRIERGGGAIQRIVRRMYCD
jgi:hypothetical protein